MIRPRKRFLNINPRLKTWAFVCDKYFQCWCYYFSKYKYWFKAETHFTKDLWAYNSKFVKFPFALRWKLGSFHTSILQITICRLHGPLDRYVNLRVVHAPGMPGTFPRHRLLWKPPVSDPGMHHGMCATHVPWCMSRSLSRDGGENAPGIPGACATHNFTYLVRGPWGHSWSDCIIKVIIKAKK